MSNAPSCPLWGFGQVVPTAATRVGKFGDHTSLTEEHLVRRAKEVSNLFDDNPAFLELRKNLAEVEQDLNNTFHGQHLSGGTHLGNAVVEQFLCTFCNKVFLPHPYCPHSIITTDDILSSPPRHDVSANRLFWKMVAKFCVYCQKESFVNPEQKQYLSTACASWQCNKTIYCCLTHKWIDYNIALEVSALITEESIHKAKPKPVAHYCDLVTFITDGVFGNHLLLRCVMGLDAQEAGRSVNSYEGSAGIKESGRSSARAKLISRTPPRSVVEETMWQIPRRSVARMIVRRIHMRGGPSAAKEGTQLRSMQLVTTQGPQDEDLENRRRSKEEELCQGHQQAGHEEEEQCRSN
ncbi:uncharacterized protein UHOD_11208 [Ustilago sp. UG-2017b]|nr:uncharacterized protein UHOD_11208 [Ustilago sp. UG-2017b]